MLERGTASHMKLIFAIYVSVDPESLSPTAMHVFFVDSMAVQKLKWRRLHQRRTCSGCNLSVMQRHEKGMKQQGV
jgi:hypothetical protein